MPFALAIIGIVLFVTAIKGSTSYLFGLVKDDFTGTGNFLYWVFVVLLIGSIGYIKPLKPFANGFLLLIMIVLFIGAGNKGVIKQFLDALETGTANCPSFNSSPSLLGGGQHSIESLLGNQAKATPPNALYAPGQSLQQQLNNSLQNLNNALNTSPTLGGG